MPLVDDANLVKFTGRGEYERNLSCSGFLIDRLGFSFLFQSMTALAVIGSLLSLLLVKFAPAKTPLTVPAQD